MDLHCYLVTYDISCPRRWRKVYRIMHAFGEHVQLSVFRCDLTPQSWTSEYRVVDDVRTPGTPARTLRTFVVENGRPGARPV